ncbi:DNA-binding protein [candidate division WOR-3 bacterium]|uniref:DNA-binding protein n=1 Tax=candidate division WOR-3 bacterium TaxID=2052148 RepID=A0A660SL41_UNCW3|nr:MAG: DNA-binding protein [candidate division WOR-3 bacterium]
MRNRWNDWLRQAKRDLAHARRDLEDEFYEWACFSAQQAAEKAVKAVYLFRNMEAWGHSVSGLLMHLLEIGARLDRFYIPTRYANSFETGAPKEAIQHAEEIIKYCEGLLTG